LFSSEVKIQERENHCLCSYRVTATAMSPEYLQQVCRFYRIY